MNLKRIDEIVAAAELQPFRAKQLRKAFFELNVSCFADVTTLKKDIREKLTAEQSVLTVEPERVQHSNDGRAHKALLRLADGHAIETVLMETKPGLWTTCVSCQVGCGVGCSFCATGGMGLIRNLTAEEITDQVLFWRQYATSEDEGTQPPRNVVFMGMGEPFHNSTNVFDAISELLNPDAFNMGSRHISVSTCGILKPIAELAERFPQVNLSISLHAANDDLRERLVPINKTAPLRELTKAVNTYLRATNRKVFFEYVLLNDVNDAPRHADELAKYIQNIEPMYLAHVNLIVYNTTDSEYRAPKRDRVRDFHQLLQSRGVSCTIRRSLGADIDGACGQLAGKER